MRIYFDVCALGRPYDDPEIIRNQIEAAAVHLIITLAEMGKYTICRSPVHDVEIKRNPDSVVSSALLSLLDGLGKDIRPNIDTDLLMKRVNYFRNRGMHILDAFHVAHAEQVKAAFITCDDQLLGKCRRANIEIWYGTPVDFCRKEGRL
jgi:hypothetical protein